MRPASGRWALRFWRPPLTRPPDFEAFWSGTSTELGRIPPAISREPLYSEDPALGFERLTFDSLGGGRISGYVIRWRDEVPRPLVVHGHGYGGGLDPMWRWAETGVNVVGVEARGYGRSRYALPSPSRWGYVMTGIESPEGYVLRGAVCDYMRAVEAGREILGPLASRTVPNGTSFAGGLAVMAQGVMQVADLPVVAVPSFGWAEGRRSLVEEGPGQEINRYLEAHPEREEDLMVVLSYFDPMNFAVDIRCPTLVGLGLEDDVVPAPTVYAIANHLSGPREVVRLPVSHTDRPEEKLWDRFEAYWLRLATRGVPRTSERTENDRSRRSRRRSPDLVGGGDTALAHPPPKVTPTPARAMTAATEMAVAVPNSFVPAKVPPRL